MRKILVTIIAFISVLDSGIVYAQSGAESPGILPATNLSVDDCNTVMAEVDESFGTSSNAKSQVFENRGGTMNITVSEGSRAVSSTDILGCGIKTGNISLWMVPYYIRFILEFIIGLAGIIAVGGIVYGGYLYLFAGLSDDKDRGKKAITYGLGGFILTMLAFGLVNIVIALVSS